jgi:hypothetical protein
VMVTGWCFGRWLRMMMIPWQYPEGNDNGSDVDGQ